jgi:hypothetical protein
MRQSDLYLKYAALSDLHELPIFMPLSKPLLLNFRAKFSVRPKLDAALCCIGVAKL